MDKKLYDLIIIGMGISGISAAVYSKRANLDILIIDKAMPGGLLNTIESVDNFPSYVNVSGPDLAMKLKEQLDSLEVECKYEEVRELIDAKEHKIVITNNDSYEAKYVLIATGRSQKTLGLSNEQELLGRGISSCALCDANFYKGKDIAVVGGGNSALQEALYLAKIVDKIYLIHRKDKFTANNSLISKVKNTKNIEIIYNSTVTELISKDDCLDGIVLNSGAKLDVKGLFVYIGFTPKTKFIANLNITDERGYIIVNEKGETKVNGIYASGDIIAKKYYQLINAASEGILATLDIIDRLK